MDPALKQLDDVDGLLIAPATRNLMASHLHGMMSSPLLMAMSAARRRGTPVMLVPSMHDDLAEDPVTERLVKDLRSPTTSILWSESDEGRRKQPDATHVVASFSHHLRAMEVDRIRRCHLGDSLPDRRRSFHPESKLWSDGMAHRRGPSPAWTRRDGGRRFDHRPSELPTPTGHPCPRTKRDARRTACHRQG